MSGTSITMPLREVTPSRPVWPERSEPSPADVPQHVLAFSGRHLDRTTEPSGAFLRSNDPAAGRWYSRDVEAIAAFRGLHDAAPFFIDADAASNPGGYPVGGLTVVRFHNNHLLYALTWFAMAFMLADALLRVVRDRWHFRGSDTRDNLARKPVGGAQIFSRKTG